MKCNLAGSLMLSALMFTTITVFAGSEEKDDFAQGMHQIELLNFKKAGDLFESGMNRSKEGSPQWIEFALGYAISLHRRQPDTASDKIAAAELYAKVVKYAKASNSKYYPLALLQQGKLYEMDDFQDDKSNPDKAYQCYDTVIKDCPASNLIHYAALCRAQVLIFQMRDETVIKGINELQAWIAKYPDNPFAPVQRTLAAEAFAYPLRDFRQAVTTMKTIEKTGFPSGTLVDQFYWELANYAYKDGDIKTAREYFNKIVSLGNSRFGTVAKDRLKNIGNK